MVSAIKVLFGELRVPIEDAAELLAIRNTTERIVEEGSTVAELRRLSLSTAEESHSYFTTT